MLFELFVGIALASLGYLALTYWRKFNYVPPLPNMDLEEWWGPTHLKTTRDESIRPFKIEFQPGMIEDLKDRLSRVRTLTPPLEGVAFEYGFNTNYMDTVIHYWKNVYNFEERLQYFNKYPHFKTFIQGLNIHFISVKPEDTEGVEVVPVLLLHGWPGSILEFYELIPMLTSKRRGRNFVFEVIVPSLPGFGFSDPAVRPGLAAPQMAVVMRNLMRRLGYKRYYIQGGDWGSVIGSHMSTLFPEDILGYHTNMPFIQSRSVIFRTLLGTIFPSVAVEDKYVDRVYPLSKTFWYFLQESGYFHLQATKPDTIGIALNDSPAGFAAYILEKFGTWTVHDYKHLPDNGLTRKFTFDQLIDNLMIYWSTGTITTAMRIYAEDTSFKKQALQLDEIPTPVPAWALQSKYEQAFQSPLLLRQKFPNFIDTTPLDEGGHFLAYEIPEVVAEDVFKAVSAFRDWHSKNKTITNYR